MRRVVRLKEFINWFSKLTNKEQALVDARISRIRLEGHFGDVKHLGESLFELRWRNGKRVYFTIAQDQEGKFLILILGGYKNSQRRDISKAQKLIKKLQGYKYE